MHFCAPQLCMVNFMFINKPVSNRCVQELLTYKMHISDVQNMPVLPTFIQQAYVTVVQHVYHTILNLL